MIHRFADCELDRDRVVLRRDGHDERVEPQAFDVLCHLVDHRGHVVRKEELLDAIWGDRFVSESALTTQIKSVRRAVGDDGQRQRIIRTVHGKGYEFVADVTTVDDSIGAEVDPSGDGGAARPSVGATSRLPAAMQELIGRDALLDVLAEEITAHRLVTLVGPGGVGKTSVAYELARRIEADYVDGVHLVELVTVADEGAAYSAVATALDVNTRRSVSIEDAITDLLRPRHALLVLDNCEHLVEAVAGLVTRVLRAAPNVAILATSRESLAVQGEHVWSVDPLPVDAGSNVSSFDLAEVPAVALFVARARAVQPGFELDVHSAPAVLEICRRLDGIPLAIELAAARTRALDVAEIAVRLDQRFRLLQAIRRATDPRHRTLYDAISWSYDLLDGDEQRLFSALSVFAGPFELQAAEAISGGGDVVDVLSRLTERSMLVVRHSGSGGTRYELLETLREYGRQRLGGQQRVDLNIAHAAHFAALAKVVENDLHTDREGGAMERATASFAELRAAQRLSMQIGDVDTALRLIVSIGEFAMRALRNEVFSWADDAAESPDAIEHPLYTRVIGVSAYSAWVRGDYDGALALARRVRAEEEARHITRSGLAERVLTNVLLTIGAVDAGLAEAWSQIDAAEASGNRSRLVHACYMASVASSSTGSFDDAAALADRARRAAATTASPTDIASVWTAEGFAARDDEVALESFSRADDVASSVGNRWMCAFARTEAAGLLIQRGDLTQGCARLAETVDVWYRAGDWSQLWHTLTRCIIALDLVGRPELASEVVGAIEDHLTIGAPPLTRSLRLLALNTRESLVATLGADRDEERRRLGATRPLADTVHRTTTALLGRDRPRSR